MNKKLQAKLDMFRAVRAVHSASGFTSAINAVTGIANAFTRLTAHIAQIESLDSARGDAAAGAGLAKSVARNLMTISQLVVDGIFTAHAASTGDHELLARVNKEANEFHEMADENLRAPLGTTDPLVAIAQASSFSPAVNIRCSHALAARHSR